MAERKKLNNRVQFYAHGNYVTFRLSDNELRLLRRNSIWKKGEDWENFNKGTIYRFAVFALFDYDIKGSKAKRFNANFDYHKCETMYWEILK